MAETFRTSDEQRNPDLRPVRVPQRREDVFSEARNLASELPRWRILEADEGKGVLVCERAGGLLTPPTRITLSFEGPPGIPSTTVSARTESRGGWLATTRDRARALELMRPLHRRVG